MPFNRRVGPEPRPRGTLQRLHAKWLEPTSEGGVVILNLQSHDHHHQPTTSNPPKMDIRQMMRQMQGMGGGADAAPAGDSPQNDNAETVYISSLALLKMLKHGRAGVPMEVMGLMLGEFVDDYTVTCIDVFAMPQSGTSVTVESVSRRSAQ